MDHAHAQDGDEDYRCYIPRDRELGSRQINMNVTATVAAWHGKDASVGVCNQVVNKLHPLSDLATNSKS